MKKILLMILLGVSLSAGSIIDIDAKVKQAQLQDKDIAIFFHIPNCSYCGAMLDENFKNKEILQEIKKNFILVDMFTANKNRVKYKDFKGTIKEFSRHMGAIAYPATIFLSKNQKILYRSIGYRNTQEQLMELMFISSKSYNKLTLEEFVVKTEFDMDD